MTTHIKELVSKQKRRFIQDGFNLDLTYISGTKEDPGPNVIAMGFPASNYEAIYRNSMEDVRRLLEEKHKDHYKLYNLCSERGYDPQKFQGRVAFYPFDDHCPPEFAIMKPFCEDVDQWLKEREGNIAVVHCKAGKGRTGLMICAYLLHCRHSLTAEEVLNFYASKRTLDDKGVTIPSQRRYVDYYAAMVNQKLPYNPVKLYLYSFVIDPLPALGLGQQEGYIQFEIRQTRIRPYESKVYQVKRTDGRINIVLPQPLLIVGDVKIEFFTKLDVFSLGKSLGKNPKFISKSHLFHFWINTFFIDLERSTPLTHDVTEPSPEQLFNLNMTPLRSSPLTHESLSSRPSLPAKTAQASCVADPAVTTDTGSRNCRSNHNSGGTDSSGNGIGAMLPPPRQLQNSGEATGTAGGGSGNSSSNSSSGQIDQQDHDPRTSADSCLASVQTIHSQPQGRTVSIVEPIKQRTTHCDDDLGVRVMSISDDTLADKGVIRTTQSSFKTNRRRHTSVPMTSGKTGSSGGGGSGQPTTRFTQQIPGKLMSVRLRKNQIDKADKDKSSRFADNFNVTLFLVRPNDQTLKDEFNRPNAFCQHADEGNGMNGGDGGVVEATDSSNLDYWTGDSSNFWEEKASSDEDGHSQDAGSGIAGVAVSEGAGDDRVEQPGLNRLVEQVSVSVGNMTSLETNSGSAAQACSGLSQPARHVHAAASSRFEKTAVVSGMVRNATEPAQPLSSLTNSTWI